MGKAIIEDGHSYPQSHQLIIYMYSSMQAIFAINSYCFQSAHQVSISGTVCAFAVIVVCLVQYLESMLHYSFHVDILLDQLFPRLIHVIRQIERIKGLW